MSPNSTKNYYINLRPESNIVNKQNICKEIQNTI